MFIKTKTADGVEYLLNTRYVVALTEASDGGTIVRMADDRLDTHITIPFGVMSKKFGHEIYDPANEAYDPPTPVE